MSSSPRVFWVEIRKSEEVVRGGADHVSGYACAELKDLATDVTKEEGIRGPTPNEHNGKNRNSSQVHGHSSARAKQVSADVGRRKIKYIFALREAAAWSWVATNLLVMS
jgi:hypothetical protein